MATEIKEAEASQAIEKSSNESVTIFSKVKALEVTDQKTYDQADAYYRAALEIEKAIHAAHDPVCNHWNKIWKTATDARKADLDRVLDAKKLAKKKRDDFELEQERLRLAEERQLQEEARRKAEAEARAAREAAEAEARQRRQEEEAERIRLAEEAAATGATEEQVDAILDQPLAEPEPIPEIMPFIPVAPSVPRLFNKAAGPGGRWNYSADCVNLNELIKAAAGNPFFAQFLQPNQQAINAQARATKDAFQMPGCRLRKDRV